MAIPLPKYAKIKDNYCVGYFGNDSKVVVQLKRVRPFIEKALPGLKLFISCHDKFFHLLAGEPQVVPGSELPDQVKGYAFAYYRELDRDDPNAVRTLLVESNITVPEETLNF